VYDFTNGSYPAMFDFKCFPFCFMALNLMTNVSCKKRKKTWTCPLRLADEGCYDNSIHP
jgi:hypothetical protein